MNCALGNYIDDDLRLRLENPIQYYLNHIDDEELMINLVQDDPYLYLQILRIKYVQEFKTRESLHKCPDCKGSIVSDEWGEEYCSECGLVTRSHYNYVAGQKINLPYGLK